MILYHKNRTIASVFQTKGKVFEKHRIAPSPEYAVTIPFFLSTPFFLNRFFTFFFIFFSF